MSGFELNSSKIKPVNEIFQNAGLSFEPKEIEISKIKNFENHPFKIMENEDMENLIDSISKNGIFTPVIIRKIDENQYEMISGHRRMYAAKKCGLTTLPSIIKDYSDDDATIAMVDANIQRENILPSEKGFALRMKMDAMNRKGTNNDGTGCLTRDAIGEEMGMSGKSVQNYISLTRLIPGLLEMIDNGEIGLTPAFSMTQLEHKIQKYMYDYIKENNAKFTPKEIRIIKEYCEGNSAVPQDEFNELADTILNKPVTTKRKVTINNKKLTEFFPDNYSSEQIEDIIYKLLDEWSAKHSK